jgi:BirA family biotin operon repressor/biotin-[acetyl-CoA-carboxylase] ligase
VSPRLGTPRLHLRETDSTSDRARALALRGAPHGTLVTAGAQTAGRGRQGRTWTAPAGRALLMSLVLRRWPPLLPLAAAVAVADIAGAGGADITIKWPNDVLLGRGKLAGILVEARPQDGWAVLGIGMNVAVRRDDLPEELRDRAAVLGLDPAAIEPTLAALLEALDARLALDPPELLDAFRARDALLGRRVRWQRGEGTAAGVDEAGRLLVDRPDGEQVALDAGEVHLARAP